MRTLLSESMLVYIGIGAGAFVLLLGIIFFAIGKHKDKIFNTNIVDSSNSLRVFVLDVKNDTVRYFNRSKLTKRRTSTMSDFYNQFSFNERQRLIEWIGNLLNAEKSVPNYLEINVMVSRNHRNYFSLLQVEKIDRENQIIYLESYLLRYMYSSRKNPDVLSNRFCSKDNFTHQLMHTNSKGVTFAITFFNKKPNGQGIPRVEFCQIKNLLVNYINQKRIMYEHDEHQIIISDFKINTKSQFTHLYALIKNEINKYLLISSSFSDIGFSVGCVMNRFFIAEPSKIIETALNLSNIAHEDNTEIIYYEEGQKFDADDSSRHYRTEVEQIIQDKRLKYLFCPVFNKSRNVIDGYQLSIEILDSFFDSFEELQAYAMRTGDNHELFATVTRTGVGKFIQENPNQSYRLYIPLSYNDINYVNRIFAHIARIKETKIVLVMNERELSDIVDEQNEGFLNTIHQFKTKGFEVALAIDNNELPCKPIIYESFDMFILSVKGHINHKNASTSMPSFQRLIEKLLHYNKIIIATDIPTWDILELVVKFGINIISSEAISPKSENVLPIAKKSLDKIMKIQL